ncbi:MAG: excinuclease ABC subunit UvrA [Endomicrobium sp.]|nr:excinuclease ABC subunit UvrA [Endomicrobium sp.]
MNVIKIRGARQHNLKNINLDIPRNKIVVITGLSGSGKSSLAFDTIYAEGQRRYVESLSSYARQFLGLMEKPDVDIIEGLSPSISIEQRKPSHNPRSTVGTVTEIYDYLRVLFSKIGIIHCPRCGEIIKPQSSQQIINEIMNMKHKSMVNIFSPIIRGKTGSYEELFLRLKKNGYSRVRVDKNIYSLDENIKLDRYKKHSIDILVDRIIIDSDMRSRIADSVELALKESKGSISVVMVDGKNFIDEIVYSEHYSCFKCKINILEIEPRLFSFNSPFGACQGCDGLGNKIEIDENLIIPNKNYSIEQGAIAVWSERVITKTNRWGNSYGRYCYKLLSEVAKNNNISMNIPWNELTLKQKKIILYGDNNFEGVITNVQRRYNETESNFVKEEIYNKYMRKKKCSICNGQRLKKDALSILINGKSISDVAKMSIYEASSFFNNLVLNSKQKIIAKSILKEIIERLKFLNKVGLEYLSLSRESGTLSGGEWQRIHLATQIGSSLTGVLYVLDEPSIGLHQRDNDKLLETLKKLKNLGNSLIIVEHDEETIRSADYIVDLGPGAGINGGNVVVAGELKEILKSKNSLTGKYLNKNTYTYIQKKRKKPSNKLLVIEGAEQFNLKNINVSIPLGLFVCITGVSGSGKSTLVHEIIYKNLASKLYRSKEKPGKFKNMYGIGNIDKVVIVDQSPIGRTPRSNSVTYTGAFSIIRNLFSQVKESKIRGYFPGRFSFNVKGGRCENCKGDGVLKVEMQFLPSVYIKCDVCKKKRFNDETLQIKYKNKNISEVLNMTIKNGVKFFENIPTLKRILSTLNDVGLGYMPMGQQATTLSGGEAQRIKLASELSKKSTGKTMYILDEPTTGLHFSDVENLINILRKFSCTDNTVLVIEHNLDVIKNADWIIDLGPNGGEKGGTIVAEGSPDDIMNKKESFTGYFLKKHVYKL